MKDRIERIPGMVSICIPTYNGSQHLKETIDSVLIQDYENVEIIINDDCSTDETQEIIKNYSDSRIRFSCNDKSYGLGGNWNKTIALAKGEYIKLLCQDDLLSKDAISTQANALINNPSATCSIGNTSVIDENGKEVMKRNRFKESSLINGKKYAKKSFRGRNIYAEPANLMYRAQYFDIFGGYDTDFKYAIDWDFALRLSYAGNIYCTSSHIMSFRMNSGSETTRLYAKENKGLTSDTIKLIDKHIKLNKIKITKLDRLFFIAVIKSFMILRGLIIKLHN